MDGRTKTLIELCVRNLKNNIFFSILAFTSRKKYQFEEGIEMRQKQKLEKDVFFIEKKSVEPKKDRIGDLRKRKTKKLTRFLKGTKKTFS